MSSNSALTWKGIKAAEQYTVSHLVHLDSYSKRSGEVAPAGADAAAMAQCDRLFQNRMAAGWITSSNLPPDKAQQQQPMVLAGRVPTVPAGALIPTQVEIPSCAYESSSARHRILAFFLSCRSSPERAVATRAFRENKVLQEERDLVAYKTYFDSMFETSELVSESDYTSTTSWKG